MEPRSTELKEFDTLRGFMADEEAEDFKPSFAFHATLRIFSNDGLDFGEIDSTLGLVPTTTRRIGDRPGPRSPPSKHDVWMYQVPVPEERDLHHHIDALWEVLEPHAAFLRSLKSRATVDVFLGYSSNVDHAGISIPPNSLEMFVALEIDLGVSIVVLPDD
jgi:predicted AlkP superfamily pyrophosphatase or phosphodiesterase